MEYIRPVLTFQGQRTQNTFKKKNTLTVASDHKSHKPHRSKMSSSTISEAASSCRCGGSHSQNPVGDAVEVAAVAAVAVAVAVAVAESAVEVVAVAVAESAVEVVDAVPDAFIEAIDVQVQVEPEAVPAVPATSRVTLYSTPTSFTRSGNLFKHSMARLLITDLAEVKCATSAITLTHIAIDAASEVDFKARLDTFSGGLVWQFPGEVFLTGGSMSVALDATLDATSPLYAKTDLDFVILGSSGRKREIVKGIFQDFNTRHDDIATYITGCCIYVYIAKTSRRYCFVLAHEKYASIADVLAEMDGPHNQLAYDGVTITMTTAAVTAMATRETRFAFNSVATHYKALIRNYVLSGPVDRCFVNPTAPSPFSFVDLVTHSATPGATELPHHTDLSVSVAVRMGWPQANVILFGRNRVFPSMLAVSDARWVGTADFASIVGARSIS